MEFVRQRARINTVVLDDVMQAAAKLQDFETCKKIEQAYVEVSVIL
jgi:hypothetical protein